jgi:NAD(P)-dependent dehydrogenase (short-subunit alcohol dehydrogenase family)
MFSKEKELHVLFNNGGVMVPPIEQLTEDGYDLQFGTNVLGHYYFTILLLPALLAGTITSGDGKARVVNTSSSTHMFSNMNFDTFTDGLARKKAGTQTLYSQSKHVRVVHFVRDIICLMCWSCCRALSYGRLSSRDAMVIRELCPPL